MLNKETVELIESLYLTESQRELLIQAFEWEKQLSWSVGCSDAMDLLEVTTDTVYEA